MQAFNEALLLFVVDTQPYGKAGAQSGIVFEQGNECHQPVWKPMREIPRNVVQMIFAKMLGRCKSRLSV